MSWPFLCSLGCGVHKTVTLSLYKRIGVHNSFLFIHIQRVEKYIESISICYVQDEDRAEIGWKYVVFIQTMNWISLLLNRWAWVVLWALERHGLLLALWQILLRETKPSMQIKNDFTSKVSTHHVCKVSSIEVSCIIFVLSPVEAVIFGWWYFEDFWLAWVVR